MISVFAFSCPACGRSAQHFSVLKSLNRKQSKLCSSCGIKVESNVAFGPYLILIAYIQVVTIFSGFPLVMGIVARNWSVTILCLLIFALLVWPPAMMLHAKNPIVRDKHRGIGR